MSLLGDMHLGAERALMSTVAEVWESLLGLMRPPHWLKRQLAHLGYREQLLPEQRRKRSAYQPLPWKTTSCGDARTASQTTHCASCTKTSGYRSSCCVWPVANYSSVIWLAPPAWDNWNVGGRSCTERNLTTSTGWWGVGQSQ